MLGACTILEEGGLFAVSALLDRRRTSFLSPRHEDSVSFDGALERILSGTTLGERARMLSAIAHPDDREDLYRAWHAMKDA